MSSRHSTDAVRTQMQEINPYEFEEFIADLWQEEGWNTGTSGGSSDMGVDVIARQSGAIDQKLAIQVKRYSDGNKVGRPAVQQYHSLKTQDSDVDAVVVVTTSEFTSEAKAWAYDHNVKLVDGDELSDMVQRHGRQDLVDQYTGTSPPDSGSADESVSQNNQPSKKHRGRIHEVALVALAQLLGLALIAVPSMVPALAIDAGLALLIVGWFGTPVTIYRDLKALAWAGGSKTGAIIMSLVSFLLPILPACWYTYRRLF